MARKTALDRLNEALGGILEEYAGDVRQNLTEVAAAMGQKGAQALRAKSRETFPVKKGHKITGEYAKGWKHKV